MSINLLLDLDLDIVDSEIYHVLLLSLLSLFQVNVLLEMVSNFGTTLLALSLFLLLLCLNC